jgi:hypothetical protein
MLIETYHSMYYDSVIVKITMSAAC